MQEIEVLGKGLLVLQVLEGGHAIVFVNGDEVAFKVLLDAFAKALFV